MSKAITKKKEKQELDIQKKVNHPRKELKRIKDLLVVTMVRQAIHQINVGAMEKVNSMESATIAINTVIGKMNAKRNLSLKENVINVKSMGTNPQNTKLRY